MVRKLKCKRRPRKSVRGLLFHNVNVSVGTAAVTLDFAAVIDVQLVTHSPESVNLLQKVESGLGCPDWHTAMHGLSPQRLLWIYCPGHTGASGNEWTDRLASTADITLNNFGLQLGRAEVLRGLRNFLNKDRPEKHSIDHLKEKGEGRKEAADIPPSKVENDLCSTR